MSPSRPAASGPVPPEWSGLLPLDKPRGMTSHDVVERARRRLGMRAVGHLGTLDPNASGTAQRKRQETHHRWRPRE